MPPREFATLGRPVHVNSQASGVERSDEVPQQIDAALGGAPGPWPTWHRSPLIGPAPLVGRRHAPRRLATHRQGHSVARPACIERVSSELNQWILR
jgi:hypothetical protein